MVRIFAVNQNLIEPLCKSVDGCAKMPGAWPALNPSGTILDAAPFEKLDPKASATQFKSLCHRLLCDKPNE